MSYKSLVSSTRPIGRGSVLIYLCISCILRLVQMLGRGEKNCNITNILARTD